jgi:hypothetical protein
MLDLKDAGGAIGVTLILWGMFTFALWISTFVLSTLLFLIFLTLWIAFFLLGFGALRGDAMLHQWGGYVGLVCGSLAIYGCFATVTNATYGRTVVPVGARR